MNRKTSKRKKSYEKEECCKCCCTCTEIKFLCKNCDKEGDKKKFKRPTHTKEGNKIIYKFGICSSCRD